MLFYVTSGFSFARFQFNSVYNSQISSGPRL